MAGQPGYVNVDTIYEEEGKEKQEIKNDFTSVEEMIPVELDMKKSRFIGMAFHVESDDDVHQIIGNLKKSNKNAKHVAYAYILGETYDVAKNSDDGEPAGSAGAPIFEALKKFHITNTLVAVVRYFGGVELGKSRLTRVYNATAIGALNEAKKYSMVYCNEVEIKVSYQNYGSVNKLFADSNVHIIEQKNDESMPIIKIAVPVKTSEKVLNSVRARTRGAGVINKYGTGFYKFPYKGTITE
ncbi:MAG: YigZ family protein [Clostridia bacterium]|nr:YigZ family protein [Clostridia bacterium]